jgi:hypothetical protein
MPEQVLDKKRLACFALADKHDHLIVSDTTHVELFEPQIQATGGASS